MTEPIMGRVLSCTVLCTLLLGGPGWAQNGKIIEQQRDAAGEGYTVMRVWGSHHDMGHAQGFMLAADVEQGVTEVKSLVGAMYGQLRTAMQATVWKPAGLEQELDGMVAGVKAARPQSALDATDVKIVNTFGDWSYACRSHSAWGSRVASPSRTISTRRLDFGVPGTMKTVRHHVLMARQPSDGSVPWVNLAWPAHVTSVTGVNEYGTLASLHDYNSTAAIGAHMPRVVAVRYALTLVQGLPLDQHLDHVFDALKKDSIVTGTFINYYVPEGHGGVLTCPPGQPCSKKRTPQSDYFGGEVLITTNSETDGHTTPSGGEFMESYYSAGGAKTVADSQALMGHNGMHLLSVDYRGRGEMALWFEGQLSSGVTPTVKVEWSQLFSSTTSLDGAASGDGGTSSDVGSGSGSDGCSIGPVRGAGDPRSRAERSVQREAGLPGALVPLLLLLLLAVIKRRRRS